MATVPITRKFILASAAAVGSFVLCLLHDISGGEWVTAIGLILGIHGTANVIDKTLGGTG